MGLSFPRLLVFESVAGLLAGPTFLPRPDPYVKERIPNYSFIHYPAVLGVTGLMMSTERRSILGVVGRLVLALPCC